MNDPDFRKCKNCPKDLASPKWNQRFCSRSCKAKAKYRRDGIQRKLRVAMRLSHQTLTARTAELCDQQARQKPRLSPSLKVMAEVLVAEMQVRRWENRLAERLDKQARMGGLTGSIRGTQFLTRNSELQIPDDAQEMGMSCTDGTLAVVLFASSACSTQS